nr:MAG TPA: hypothetical protein [Bacteriophage sp.]
MRIQAHLYQSQLIALSNILLEWFLFYNCYL